MLADQSNKMKNLMYLVLMIMIIMPMIFSKYDFACIFCIMWCILCAIHVQAIIYGKYLLHNKPRTEKKDFPGVSVLKPLMGIDGQTLANLESFFTMTYPKFELLFCVENNSDPVIDLVNSLIRKYPKINAKLYIGISYVGINPKINNMNKGYEAAKYDFILISDSGIRMKGDTLQDMMAFMSDKTALVHQMPFSGKSGNYAATFEKLFFGTIVARPFLVADCLNINFVFGMSGLFRKSVIDEAGGLKRFGCYIAEDYFMCKELLDRGWSTQISNQPAMQYSMLSDVKTFQTRCNRWTRFRLKMAPLVVLIETLLEYPVIGACTAWSVSVLFKWNPVTFYFIHTAFWLINDWILLCVVQNESLPANKLDFLVSWLHRQYSAPFYLLDAIYNPIIDWRGRKFDVHWGGITEEFKPNNTM